MECDGVGQYAATGTVEFISGANQGECPVCYQIVALDLDGVVLEHEALS